MIPKQFIIAGGSAIALALAVVWHGGQVRAVHDAGFKAGVEAATVQFMEDQARAESAAKARADQIAKEGAAATKETTDAFHQAMGGVVARADAIRVRHDAAPKRDRPTDDATGAPGGAPGAYEAPPCDGLSWSVAFPLMVQAEANQIQLNALITWEEEQQALWAKHAQPGTIEGE